MMFTREEIDAIDAAKGDDWAAENYERLAMLTDDFDRRREMLSRASDSRNRASVNRVLAGLLARK